MAAKYEACFEAIGPTATRPFRRVFFRRFRFLFPASCFVRPASSSFVLSLSEDRAFNSTSSLVVREEKSEPCPSLEESAPLLWPDSSLEPLMPLRRFLRGCEFIFKPSAILPFACCINNALLRRASPALSISGVGGLTWAKRSESLSRLDPPDEDGRGELMVGRGNRSAGCCCWRTMCSSTVEALLSIRTREGSVLSWAIIVERSFEDLSWWMSRVVRYVQVPPSGWAGL